LFGYEEYLVNVLLNMSVIKVAEFDTSKMTFTELTDHTYVSSQKVAYMSYNGSNKLFSIQTPYILIETYGIPKEGPYHQDIKSRAFSKLRFVMISKSIVMTWIII